MRIHRSPCGLRQKKVQDAEERHQHDKADQVVSGPRLDNSVLQARVSGYALDPARWHRQIVDDVNYWHSDDHRQVEPDRNKQVPDSPARNRSEHVAREHYPDEKNPDVDRPLELGVAPTLGNSERKSGDSCEGDGLPSPEVDLTEPRTAQSCFQQPLYGVVHPAKDGIPRKREQNEVCMQRWEPDHSEKNMSDQK